jgi:hypothetical protein
MKNKRELSPLMMWVAFDSFMGTHGRKPTPEEAIEVLDEWFPDGWFFMIRSEPDENGEFSYERVDKTTPSDMN